VEIDLNKLEKLSQQEAGTLKVERYSPEGKQKDPVTTLSITFNQPMIEVTSLKEIKEMMKGIPFTFTSLNTLQRRRNQNNFPMDNNHWN
jgi:hypothetical protein